MRIYPKKSVFGWKGDNGLGNTLIEQIIQGDKTATCSFKAEYTETELEDVLGSKGEMVTVVDQTGTARCNIRILDVFETTFGNPDMRLVRGEGDGNDVRAFQEDHRRAWHETMQDAELKDDTVLVVELFELVGVAEEGE